VDDKLETLCFNFKDGDFCNKTTYSLGSKTSPPRRGLFSCLEAGMTVPGAAGPPVKIVRGADGPIDCFDAFCFEPIPYRSPAQDGATHVLALRSRPDGCKIKIKPGVYEKTIIPLYFKNQPKVVSYFKKGGQQFRYLEDVMTLDKGRCNASGHFGVFVPPKKILYGNKDLEKEDLQAEWNNRETWKYAHLLPIVVKEDKPELPVLEQGQDQVLQAVRSGFATAFDLLAPIVNFDDTLNGERVAELLFPLKLFDSALENPLYISGDVIHDEDASFHSKDSLFNAEQDDDDFHYLLSKPRIKYLQQNKKTEHSQYCRRDASVILSCLPGLQSGKLAHLADGLHWHIHT